jgi:hypothetical protein
MPDDPITIDYNYDDRGAIDAYGSILYTPLQ